MKIYRAAIIGCGKIGSEFDKELPKKEAFSHAGAYYLNPKTKLIAVSDIDKSKLDPFLKKWKVESVYADYRKMLQKEKIDILSICTPAATHLPIIKDVSQFAIKAIYCEKPIADNVRNAKKIIKICRKKNILLMINHQRRFGAFYQELKENLSNGFLGDVQQTSCYYTRGVYNTCTHIIDLFCFLFGESKSVYARYSRNNSPFKNDPNIDGVIHFKNGLSLWLKACDDSNYLILETDILTEKARLRFGDTFEYYQALRGKNLLKRNELVKIDKPPFRAEYPKYGMVPLNFGVRHIIGCLDRKEKPLSTGEDAIRALATIEALILSATNKRERRIAV